MAKRVVFTGPSYAHCPKCGYPLVCKIPGVPFNLELTHVPMVHNYASACVDHLLTFHVPVLRIECEVDE